MKRLALLALVASACSPPPEVDEIQQALTVANPWPGYAQWIFVGYRADLQQTGVVFNRRSDNACSWYPLSPGYGNGSAPTQHYTIVGSSQADWMAHIQGSYYVGCGMGYLEYPSQDNGYVIDLVSGAGNDTISCGGSAGVSNVCNAGIGNDLIWVQSYHAEAFGGEGNDSFGIDVAPNPVSSVKVWGQGGNDCVTWTGNGAGPGGNGGTGTADFTKNLAGSSQYEYVTTNNCGGLF